MSTGLMSVPARVTHRAVTAGWARLPGLGLTVALAAVGTVLGQLVPLVGAPVFGLVLGVLAGLTHRPGARLRPGIATASGFLLQLAVVVLGAQLSLPQVLHVGLSSLPVMLGTLVVCLALAALLGRWLRINTTLTTLVGVGTGICGASAIAAITPIIAADGMAVAFAISTIFAFNIAAVLTFPALGHLLGLGQHAFGLFAGTAVNDTSSVVATATTYGGVATQYAVVVKLTRTLMLIPISLGLAAWHSRRTTPAAITTGDHGAAEGTGSSQATEATSADPPRQKRSGPQRLRLRQFLPWFLVGFLIVAGINSAGLLPASSHTLLNAASLFLITTALAGIGLSLDPSAFRRTGPRPLVLGALLWIAVTTASLTLQYLTHSL